ncbi:unnamed protein product [Rhizophagus irregularis]|nr:unnamed protein product [Rhizophagus irregularis]
MGKSKEYVTTLISEGQIVESLHFGPFCHNWWLVRPINKNSTHTLLLPIRLGMKSHTVLNKRNFIITVVNDAERPNFPGFLCYSKENQSGVCSSPTEAINTCYEKVFDSNAKFPGPQVMGFDNSNIIQQLLNGIVFRPYMISLGKLNVIVLGMGKSKKPEWNYAGEGYKSVLQSNYNGVKSAFVQEIEDNECVVQIHTDDTLVKTFSAIDPDEVWLCIGRLSNYSGKNLFGLENSYTQICIQQAQIPSCTVLDWIFEDFEFWTKAYNPQKDNTTLQILYESGFLQQNPHYSENQSLTFWQAFRDALENTNRGPNGQRRILSIIATKFTYQELKSKLGVAANTVSRARQYARINGPG